MKVVLIVLIVAFVVELRAASAPGSFEPVDQRPAARRRHRRRSQPINAQYQPTVDALTSAAAERPDELHAAGDARQHLLRLGALEVQQASQTDTSAVGADQPLWIAAKDCVRAGARGQDGRSRRRHVDYAIAPFYTRRHDKARSRSRRGVTQEDPEFAPAWFNLGIFYGALGQNAKAIAAFEQLPEARSQRRASGNADVRQAAGRRTLKPPATATTHAVARRARHAMNATGARTGRPFAFACSAGGSAARVSADHLLRLVDASTRWRRCR